ncbi:MAG: hypothetical protein AAF573_06990 [Bacteroidota bacterium]
MLFLVLFFVGQNAIQGQNEIPPKGYLQWGKIHLPIHELVNGRNGRIGLKLEEILEVANFPILLFQGDEEVKLDKFFFTITKQKRKGAPKFVIIEDYDQEDAARWHGRVFLEEHLEEGEHIFLSNLMGKNGEQFFLTIEVLYDNPPKRLDFTLPPIPKGEVFGFQVVDLENQLQVKLDTTAETTLKVYNTYKDLEKYELLHIPNFKTTRRYLTEEDVIQIKDETVFNWVKNEAIKKIDLNLLPEFTGYKADDFMELKWGGMVTSNNRSSTTIADPIVLKNSKGEFFNIHSKNYDTYDLQDAIDGRFMLAHGFKNYPIKRMKVVIFPAEGTPTSYITDDINHPELQDICYKIQSNTIILITDILIENEQQEYLYFPTSFIFGIE